MFSVVSNITKSFNDVISAGTFGVLNLSNGQTDMMEGAFDIHSYVYLGRLFSILLNKWLYLLELIIIAFILCLTYKYVGVNACIHVYVCV